MVEKYLYGASIQGIQSFIFKTNKLKEIIGASEIVEQICTREFYKISGLSSDSEEIIISAAGNIRCILNEGQCRKLVMNFPKEVQKIAPGITISQVVVSFRENQEIPIQELENRIKVQRNISPMPLEIGFMGINRERRTGGLAFKEADLKNGKMEVVSEETFLKRLAVSSEVANSNEISSEMLFEKISGLKKVPYKDLSFDIEHITESSKNSWIAVIHADANGLGNILLNNIKELNTNKELKKFSLCIEAATKNATQKAFQEVIQNDKKQFENKYKSKKGYRYPIRPVVFGGDDLTVIVRADLAIAFSEVFLREFELATRKEFEKIKVSNIHQLTTCIGIAFIKESYPLHYGLHLAEELCKDAKKASREDSSIAFYKVQESFVEDLETLKFNTLRTRNGLSFYAGPYNKEKMNGLLSKLMVIQEEATKNDNTKAVGRLRQIVSESYKDKSTAIFMLKRMEQINPDFYKELKLNIELEEIGKDGISQLVDLITLDGFNYGNKDN
jgi:hypothetical protein